MPTKYQNDVNKIDTIRNMENFDTLNSAIQVLDTVDTQIWSLEDTKTYRYVNQAHADFLGLSIEEIEGKNVYSFLDRQEADTCVLSNYQVFNEKIPIITLEEVKDYKGDKKLLKITKKPILDENNNIEMIACIAEDITHQNELEKQKEMAHKILESTIDFTKELLVNEDYDAALFKGICSLGEATEVDRVYYWENHQDLSDNRWYTSQRYEWTSDGATPQIDNPVMQNVPFDDVWDFVDILSRSEHFNFHVRDIANDFTREFLEAQDILSILVLPVIIDEIFYGFIGFDSVKAEKEWSDLEISLLDSFVLLYKKSIERNLLRKDLVKVKNNFDVLINTLPGLLTVLDLEGNIIYANQTVFNRLGYKEEEIYGKSALIMHAKEIQTEAALVIGEMIVGTRDFCHLPIVDKYGHTIDVETRVTKGVWNGKPVFFSVTKDISELKMSEDKFYKAFNSSGISMFITTLDEGRVLEANDSLIELIGKEKGEVIGKTTKELNLFVDYSIQDIVLKKIQMDKKISDIEFDVHGKDGKIINGQFNIVPIYLNNQMCLLTSMIDMTSQKQMLEKLVEAKELSEQASRAKSDFLSHISHEIRTPMNAVVSYSDLLSLTVLSKKQHSYINGIKASSKMLINMINDTLDWSKIERVGVELERVDFNVDEVIDNVMNQILFKNLEDDLNVVLDHDDTIPTYLQGDPLRLQQVLLNLLSNAVKFTKKGQITLKTRLLRNEPTKVCIQFSVMDTGYGIPKEDLPLIFEPFKQSSNVSKIKQSGTGLGIPISNEIVKMMGGTLNVYTQENKGSTFFFDAQFTIGQPDLVDNPLNQPNDLLNEQKMTNYVDDVKVLVVDDNEINQEVLKEILLKYNVDVTVVDGGLKAIKSIQSRPFDVVLLDLRMPEFDGYQTIAEIRKQFNYSTLPVIAVTASVSIEEKEKTINAGFNDYLIKPIDKNKLLNLIRKWSDYASNHTNHSSRSELSSNLQNIPELDISKCLENMDYDEKFLIKLLKKFYANHVHAIEDIIDALSKRDFEKASRLIHTIKGVVGELRADAMLDLATKIEQQIHKQITPIQLINQLNTRLQSLFSFIQTIDQDEVVQPKEQANKDNVLQIIFTLKQYLEEANMESERMVDELVDALKGFKLDKQLQQLKSYCSNYDYDLALVALLKISDEFEDVYHD